MDDNNAQSQSSLIVSEKDILADTEILWGITDELKFSLQPENNIATLCQNKETNEYFIDIAGINKETFLFLLCILQELYNWLLENGYNPDERLDFDNWDGMMLCQSQTVEQTFAQFRVMVNGLLDEMIPYTNGSFFPIQAETRRRISFCFIDIDGKVMKYLADTTLKLKMESYFPVEDWISSSNLGGQCVIKTVSMPKKQSMLFREITSALPEYMVGIGYKQYPKWAAEFLKEWQHSDGE